jgi:hypothetical protein
MSDTVSDFLLERLHDWGVRRVYAYPGDGINGILGAFGRLDRSTGNGKGGSNGDGAIDFVQVRHEEMSAFMACAHAKFTGQVGVCLATSGPGAIHLLNGLYDAKMDHQPVVAIVGQSARAAIGGDYQQERRVRRIDRPRRHQGRKAGRSRRCVGPCFREQPARRARGSDGSQRSSAPSPHHLQEGDGLHEGDHERRSRGVGHGAAVLPRDGRQFRAADLRGWRRRGTGRRQRADLR